MNVRYSAARPGSVFREEAPKKVSELEIQARLFSGEYGTKWETTRGEAVEVVHFGSWNREAGPDFKDAQFRFSGGEICRGDLEVDMDPRDWERHGHATNPAFDGVRLQLFVREPGVAAFARTSKFQEVAQARLRLESGPALPLRAEPGRVKPDEAIRMVEEAAEFRAGTKRLAMSRAAEIHGFETAIFHAVAVGLGFKNNQIPFLLAAQRTGLRVAGSDVGEARLFGIAGFLEPRTFDDADEVTRKYLKPLWDEWWKVRDSFQRLVVPASFWRFHGLRPPNHPHRRLGALSTLARHFPALIKAWKTRGTEGVCDFFERLSHPYWTKHWNLNVAVLGGKSALVGSDRVKDLLVNVFFPTLPAAEGRRELQALRGITPSGRLLAACHWLVGGLDRSLLRTAWHQQGLLQLYSDFGSLSALEAWGKLR